MSEGLSRLQDKGGGAKLVRRLFAGAVRHCTSKTRIGKGADLNRPASAAGG